MKYWPSIVGLFLLLSFQTDAPLLMDSNHQELKGRIGLAIDIFGQGNMSAACDSFSVLLHQYESYLSPNDSLRGELYQWLGNTWFNRDDANYTLALEWYEKAIAVRKLPDSGSPEELVRAYRAGGLACNQLFEFSKAKSYFEQALLVVKQKNIRNPLPVANLNNALGEYFLLTGDPNQAADYYEVAVDQYGACPPDIPQVIRNLPVCQQNLGIAYDRMEQPQKSVQKYENALSHFKALKDFKGIAQCLHNLAMCYTQLNQSETALDRLEEAIKLNLHNHDSLEFARNLAEKALILIQQKKYTQALNIAQNSLSIRQKICPSGHDDLTESLRITGDCYYAQSAFQTALPFYESAIRNAKSGGIHDAILASIAAKIKCLSVIPGQETEAFHACLSLDSAYLDIRQTYLFDDARLLLSGKVKQYFETALVLTATLFQNTGEEVYLNAALRFFERTKSLMLIENIKLFDQGQIMGIPQETLAQEKDLRAAVYKIKSALKEQLPTAENQLLSQKLLSARADYRQFINTLKNSYPHFSELNAINNAPENILDIRQRLQPGQLISEFFEGKNHLFVLDISQNLAQIREVSNLDSVRIWAAQFRNEVAGEDQQNSNKNTEAAYLLYQHLLSPGIKQQEKLHALTSVCIIADGFLSYLPFDALMTEPGGTLPGDRAPFLLKKWPVSCLPSHAFLKEISTPLLNKKLSFHGFGVEYKEGPAFFSATKNEKTNTPIALRDNLGVLEYAKAEINSGQKRFKSNIWMNKDATVQNFIKNSSRCDILHLALHSWVNEQNPLHSAFVMYPDSPQIGNMLRAADIYGLNLSAKLAVLSACNTGNGTYLHGEGVQSLARAFMHAGCQSQLVSLWSIPDQSTSIIVEKFYANLEKGLPKDEALRYAKLEFIEEASTVQSLLPNTWAAMQIIGDTSPLFNAEQQSLNTYIYVLAGVLFIATIFLLLLFNFKRGNTQLLKK